LQLPSAGKSVICQLLSNRLSSLSDGSNAEGFRFTE
jgi:hypothetical protein